MANLLRRLHAETFVLNLRTPLRAAPALPAFALTRVDDTRSRLKLSQGAEPERAVRRAVGAGHRGACRCATRSNRLEEVFMRLVEARAGAERSVLGGEPAPSDARTPGRSCGTRAGRLPDDRHPRVRPHHAHLGPDPGAAGDHHGAVLRDLRQPDRPAHRRRWAASTTCSTSRPGLIMMAVITNSYGNVVSSFFGAKFGTPHRGAAGVADAQLDHPARATSAAAWCAA